MLLVGNYRLGYNQPMGGQLEPLVFADLGNPASPFPSFINLITYPISFYFVIVLRLGLTLAFTLTLLTGVIWLINMNSQIVGMNIFLPKTAVFGLASHFFSSLFI
jgi:hypothetical protein